MTVLPIQVPYFATDGLYYLGVWQDGEETQTLYFSTYGFMIMSANRFEPHIIRMFFSPEKPDYRRKEVSRQEFFEKYKEILDTQNRLVAKQLKLTANEQG